MSPSWYNATDIVQQNTQLTGYLTDQQVWFAVNFQQTFSRKFSRICSFIDVYWAGSLTPAITLILFTQAIAQLKDIYRGLIAPILINPGLLQDVFTGTLWSTRILSQPENFQVTLLISSRFPGFPVVSDTLNYHTHQHLHFLLHKQTSTFTTTCIEITLKQSKNALFIGFTYVFRLF